MIPPNASLVKYDNPVLVSRNTDKKTPRVSKSTSFLAGENCEKKTEVECRLELERSYDSVQTMILILILIEINE